MRVVALLQGVKRVKGLTECCQKSVYESRHFDGGCYKREEEERQRREWGVGSGTLMCVGVWECVAVCVSSRHAIARD